LDLRRAADAAHRPLKPVLRRRRVERFLTQLVRHVVQAIDALSGSLRALAVIRKRALAPPRPDARVFDGGGGREHSRAHLTDLRNQALGGLLVGFEPDDHFVDAISHYVSSRLRPYWPTSARN